jgi:hypothetical protein
MAEGFWFDTERGQNVPGWLYCQSFHNDQRTIAWQIRALRE